MQATPQRDVRLRQKGGPSRLPGEVSDSSVRYLAGGIVAVGLLALGFGGWASSTQLAGAVMAPGTVVVESNVKKVQHPTGGIVGEIRVKDGDLVKAGDLVMRIDETQTRANLQIIVKTLAELGVRQTRLVAERDGRNLAELVEMLEERNGKQVAEDEIETLQRLMEDEIAFFENRAKAREGQKAQLRERIAQLREEIEGLVGQRQAKTREAELIKIELGAIEILEAKQLTTINRVTALRREATRIDGERGQLQAAAAQAKGKIAEIELQILQIDADLRSEVSKELKEAQAKEGEFAERRVAAEDQLRRVDIRATQTGIVHQLAVHTVGGVINASEPVMLIVPEGDKLVLEARIAPQDIDQVRGRDQAWVRFPAFNQRTTPEIRATLTRVAADLTREQQTNQSYYVARLAVVEDELKRLDLSLMPGMPAEVHITTAERTALSYLIKPLQDQIARAFKER